MEIPTKFVELEKRSVRSYVTKFSTITKKSKRTNIYYHPAIHMNFPRTLLSIVLERTSITLHQQCDKLD